MKSSAADDRSPVGINNIVVAGAALAHAEPKKGCLSVEGGRDETAGGVPASDWSEEISGRVADKNNVITMPGCPESQKPRETLRRWERLRRRRDFERLRAGRAIRGTIFTVRYSTSPTGVSRLGVQVGKRVGSAVVRNRVKRRLREQFRRIKHRIVQPTDVLLCAHPECAEASSALIQRELEWTLARARLLGPAPDTYDRPLD